MTGFKKVLLLRRKKVVTPKAVRGILKKKFT